MRPCYRPIGLSVCLALSMFGSFSCKGSSGSGSDSTRADAETIQSLLSGLEASQSLGQPAAEAAPGAGAEDPDDGGIVVNTVGTWNVADLPPTPAEMMALYDDGSGTARFPPAGGYIQDLYGSEGLLAYVELRTVSDGWGEYQASLWAYPTLSTEVWRGLERYRLEGASWDNVILGPAGQLFEALETYYFDGRVERRSLVWARNWVDEAGSRVYDNAAFAMPSSFSSPSYVYPAAIAPPPTVPADLGDGDSYASHSTGVITFSSGMPGTSATTAEFYNQLPDGSGGVTKHWKSYARTSRGNPAWTSTSTTVGFAVEKADGSRAERSRTAVVFALLQLPSYSAVETETTDIAPLADGRASFRRVSEIFYGNSKKADTRTEIDLAETAADSDVFTGKLVVFRDGRQRAEYAATLDAENGLELRGNGNLTKIIFALNQVVHLADNPGPPPQLSIDLDNGSTFVGQLSGGALRGTYTDAKGKEKQFVITRSSIAIDGLAQGPPGRR